MLECFGASVIALVVCPDDDVPAGATLASTYWILVTGGPSSSTIAPVPDVAVAPADAAASSTSASPDESLARLLPETGFPSTLADLDALRCAGCRVDAVFRVSVPPPVPAAVAHLFGGAGRADGVSSGDGATGDSTAAGVKNGLGRGEGHGMGALLVKLAVLVCWGISSPLGLYFRWQVIALTNIDLVLYYDSCLQRAQGPCMRARCERASLLAFLCRDLPSQVSLRGVAVFELLVVIAQVVPEPSTARFRECAGEEIRTGWVMSERRHPISLGS